MKKTVSVAEVPRYVPGENWLSYDLAGGGLAVRGYAYGPSNVASPGLHDSLIVIYLRGVTRMQRTVGGRTQTTTLAPGHISLLGRKHDSTWSWDQPIEVLHLYLPATLLETVHERAFRGASYGLEVRNELEMADPLMQRIAAELVDGSALRGPGAELYAEALTQQLCIHVLRRYVDVPQIESRPCGSLTRVQVKRVRELLEEGNAAQVSLATLASALGVSEGHFIRLFKAHFGLAPHQYLVKLRLRRSKDLLSSSDLSLAEVAQQTGFSDQSHFTRLFKREFDVTPNVWRRSR